MAPMMGGMQMDQMIESQIIGMGMMNGGTIWSALAMFLIMKLVKIFMTFVPVVQDFITKYFEKWYNDKYGNNRLMNTLMNSVANDGENTKMVKSLVKFEYNKGVNNSDVTMQAVMNYISISKKCTNILYSLNFYVINEEEFTIADDVMCKVTFFEHDDKGYMDKYCFELYSYNLNIYELRKFIDKVVLEYQKEQNNQLGDNIYFFDEMHVDIPMSMDGQMRLEMAPKHMTFTMTQFNTNKSLDNLYGRHLNVAKERVYRFINKPEWYAKKGIPHTLGIMLHGPPGSGKTSFIKGTAKDLDRHLINIKLQKSTTKTQLMDLFFNTELTVLRNGQSVKIYIPLDKRIYVMEDIDSLTDIVLDRNIQFQKIADKLNDKMTTIGTGSSSLQQDPFGGSTSISSCQNNQSLSHQQSTTTRSPPSRKTKQLGKADVESVMMKQQAMNPDALNLSFLLNLLDGILETPGRVLIITTNHPEKLDSALVRPGRIDVPLEVGYCSVETMEEMLEGYYEKVIKLPDTFSESYEKTITPAEIYAIMQNNDNMDKYSLDECIEHCVSDLCLQSIENNNKAAKHKEEEEDEEKDKDMQIHEYEKTVEGLEAQLMVMKLQLEQYMADNMASGNTVTVSGPLALCNDNAHDGMPITRDSIDVSSLCVPPSGKIHAVEDMDPNSEFAKEAQKICDYLNSGLAQKSPFMLTDPDNNIHNSNNNNNSDNNNNNNNNMVVEDISSEYDNIPSEEDEDNESLTTKLAASLLVVDPDEISAAQRGIMADKATSQRLMGSAMKRDPPIDNSSDIGLKASCIVNGESIKATNINDQFNTDKNKNKGSLDLQYMLSNAPNKADKPTNATNAANLN